LTSALVGGEWSASSTSRFTARERTPRTHSTGGWLVPRAGLLDVEKIKFLTLSRLKLRPLCLPALSQSLYQLRYLGSKNLIKTGLTTDSLENEEVEEEEEEEEEENLELLLWNTEYFQLPQKHFAICYIIIIILQLQFDYRCRITTNNGFSVLKHFVFSL
jgi:hypothetical protein